MQKISIKTRAGKVEGVCDPKFSAVVDEFVTNFEVRGEVGASCAITLEGKTLVDIWGGAKTPGGAPWDRDTISIIFSSTKGGMNLCAHMLADRGELDLFAPVAKYWPEFAQNGKESALVHMALDHSVGVPHVRNTPKPGEFLDWNHMVDVIAKEQAFWVPGTRNGYHAATMSWTVGEIVHRAAKKRMGRFFADEVAKPLGLDFWIGLPEQMEGRVAPVIPPVPTADVFQTRFVQKAMSDTSSPSHLFLRDFLMLSSDMNSRDGRAAELGAGNGITNARGLAGMYAPLANGGGVNGVRLVSKDTITRMSRVSVATHEDATLMIPSRFSMGYMKSMDNRHLAGLDGAGCIMSEPAFGHVGVGGSVGFADPESRMSFGYTMNQMGPGILLNDRGQSLIDAAYRSIGYRSNAGGNWTV